MLIRTKLLLLAVVPLPVLLVLAAAALSGARTQWQAAEGLATGLSLVEAAHETASEAMTRRDADADAVTQQAKGLESLMLGEAAGEPAARRGAPAQAAEPEAPVSALSKISPDEMPEVVRAGARQLIAFSEQMQAWPAKRENVTLTQVCARYDALLRQVSALPELLGSSAGNSHLARSLSMLATLDRYLDALAKERIYVRYAIATNTLPPALVRDFTANQGISALEFNLLDEIRADDVRRQGIAAALAKGRESGRDVALAHIQSFADRQDRMGLLYDALGYGGVVYYFRDFLLRGDERSRSTFEAQAVAAAGILDELLADAAPSPAEKLDLQAIAANLATYRARIGEVATLRAQGLPIARIDERVRIDDSAALGALDRLATFRPTLTAQQWDKLSGGLLDDIRGLTDGLERELREETLHERDVQRRRIGLLAVGAALTLALLAGLANLLYRRLTDGIRSLVQEFERVASTGDVETRTVIHGDDELAQLNRAVGAIGLRLQVMADAAESMAAGDLATTLAPLGAEDRLAHAMAALTSSARTVVTQAQAISSGDYATRVEPRSPQDTLAFALADMAAALRKFRDDTQQAQWLSASQLAVLAAMGNVEVPEELGLRALGALSALTGAPLGVIYIAHDRQLEAIAQRATTAVLIAPRIERGEGLVGKALDAKTTELYTTLPARFLRLKSGLGEGDVAAVTLTPLRARNEPVGVLELGWMKAPDERTRSLLDAVAEPVGLALVAAEARRQTDALLTETRRQAERLREQQEELRQSNEELEEQTQLLRQSEEELKAQREELQTTNEELQEKTNLLQRQREQLEKTARDLSQATKYKSEFLANMSHELRTPLNSLLILSKTLVDNEEGNLNADQVQAARVIHDGGRDLLSLINDILDLSKVEAGRLDVHPQPFDVRGLFDGLKRQFEPVAEQKHLSLVVDVQADAPAEIVSDRQRVEQILRNLLSNALKFTEKGVGSSRVDLQACKLEYSIVSPK